MALGSLVGFVALARFGMSWVDFADRSSGWFLPWFSIAGIGLLGLGFIAGSIVALRNRRRAGVIFLAFMPIAAFCLAYPAAGFLVWHADGGGWFETPPPPTAIGLTVLFFVPFLAPVLAMHHRKRAASLFAIAVSLAGVVFSISRWTRVLLPLLAGLSTLFLLFGSFWLGTHKLGWPPLVQPRPRALGRRVVAVAIECLVVLCLDVAITLGLSALGSSLFSGDCRGKPPFVHSLSPSHAVFTARVIFVGRSTQALTRNSWFSVGGVHDRRVGDWAIGVVQERFWGLPWWGPRLVLLTNYIYWKDETYFIDGNRTRGLLTHVLPIVEAGINCSRTRPVHDAIVDLRVLREAPSASGTRLIGYVRQPEASVGEVAPPTTPKFAEGMRISVTGPTSTKIIATDKSGVYQLDDLPPGDYALQLLVPDSQLVGFFQREASPAKVHIDNREPVEQDFEIFWNGRIEGHVVDDSGKPAHIWVMLLNADGSQLPGYVDFALLTNHDGSYQIKKTPPGRYIVMVNSDGPYDEWPYNIQYYPSALGAEGAQILELAEGQQIKGVDFTVPRLTERTVQVRVTWPNRSPVADAPVCVAYEHTKEYASLAGTNCFTRTDQNGEGVIHLYGNSRVRLFAEQFVHNEKRKWQDTYYSHPVESEARKMPDKVSLALTPPKP